MVFFFGFFCFQSLLPTLQTKKVVTLNSNPIYKRNAWFRLGMLSKSSVWIDWRSPFSCLFWLSNFSIHPQSRWSLPICFNYASRRSPINAIIFYWDGSSKQANHNGEGLFYNFIHAFLLSLGIKKAGVWVGAQAWRTDRFRRCQALSPNHWSVLDRLAGNEETSLFNIYKK